jgi:hypothetical protein
MEVKKIYILIVFLAVFYFVAAQTVRCYGLKWTAVIWSLPITTFSIMYFAKRHPSTKLHNERKLLGYFITAYTILLLSLIAAYLVCINYHSRSVSVLAAFIVWALLASAVALYYVSANKSSGSGCQGRPD